ncbi:hypothetical protein R1flu_007343 [Riccia fluitans]|uniref:Uncharacterized protein n=1 Tax=Riccia fluitans TaxID=41844 RepID=A0ABD1YZP9_9MARC
MALVALTCRGYRTSQLRSNWAFHRGFAADHHRFVRVNIWEAPGSPSKWKEEHFVFASLGGWGTLFFVGYKAATGGSEKKKDFSAPAKPQKAKDGSNSLSPRKPETKSPAGNVKGAPQSPTPMPAKPETKPTLRKFEHKLGMPNNESGNSKNQEISK